MDCRSEIGEVNLYGDAAEKMCNVGGAAQVARRGRRDDGEFDECGLIEFAVVSTTI